MIKISPYAPSPPDRYSRIFPPTQPPFDAATMNVAGLLMRNGFPAIPNVASLLKAGYTYFGQFIDHDITRDDTPFEQAGLVGPAETVNAMGPWLDLSQLYGDGPGSSKHGAMYDGASFRLAGPPKNGEQFDVPLDSSNQPLIADDRNGENLIIRQLHAMFLKLHNLAVREFAGAPSEEKCFEQARQKLRWQYQWLVRNDYLFRVCNTDVYKDVIQNGNRIINWDKGNFSIPVEFSQAAFRFGHSMVREDYKLNSHTMHFPLQRLFEEAHRPNNISIDLAIDWEHFTGTESSMAIDTTIVPSLFMLPPDHLHHLIEDSVSPQPAELPIRTLRRGAATGLPTGEEVSCALGLAPLRLIEPSLGHWAILDAIGLTGRTPLWLYVLLEAAACEKGKNLGGVGSRIVAEVIEGSLRADCESFLNKCVPDWEPPDWISWDGKPVKIRRLHDLASVVGLSKPASEPQRGPV
jgi:Animal haem peroxidase